MPDLSGMNWLDNDCCYDHIIKGLSDKGLQTNMQIFTGLLTNSLTILRFLPLSVTGTHYKYFSAQKKRLISRICINLSIL